MDRRVRDYLQVLCAISAGLALPSLVRGQTMMESSDGTSSVVLRDGALALINLTDKSVKIGLTRITSPSPWRYGAEAKLKASDGFTRLTGEDSHPEGSARAFFGYLWKDQTRDTKLPAQWATLELGSVHATHSLMLPTATEPVRRVDSIFVGTSLTGYYNALVANHFPALPSDILVGVSAGYGRRSNYDDDALSTVSVCTASASTPATTVQQCQDAKQGAYAARNDWAGALDIGLYQGWLKNRVLLDLMGRYDGLRSDGAFTPGVGLFATKAGAPLVVIGGVTLEWKGGKKPVIGLQVGIPVT